MSPDSEKILLLDTGADNDGVVVTATMQRTGLALVGLKRDESTPINDFAQVKVCKRVWIRASGESFNVRVGYQNTVNGQLSWSDPETFNPETQLYIDVIVTGPVLAIEFSGGNAGGFAIQGYKMEIAGGGRVMPL